MCCFRVHRVQILTMIIVSTLLTLASVHRISLEMLVSEIYWFKSFSAVLQREWQPTDHAGFLQCRQHSYARKELLAPKNYMSTWLTTIELTCGVWTLDYTYYSMCGKYLSTYNMSIIYKSAIVVSWCIHSRWGQ